MIARPCVIFHSDDGWLIADAKGTVLALCKKGPVADEIYDSLNAQTERATQIGDTGTYVVGKREPVLFVDATPDDGYVQRILDAHLTNNETCRMEYRGEPNEGAEKLMEHMNDASAKRAKLLRQALAKLNATGPKSEVKELEAENAKLRGLFARTSDDCEKLMNRNALLEAVREAAGKMLAFYNDLADSNPGFMGKLCLRDYAQWNEALLGLPRALDELKKGGRG